MDVFTQIAHEGEALKGCLIYGRHAVEDEVGREKDRESENLSVELLVTVTGVQTLSVQEDRVEVICNFDRPTPYPKTSSARLNS